MTDKSYDFSGWATKNDLLCADGRTIRKDAFKDGNGQRVPLVWMHGHSDPENVLGHCLLENRPEGVYVFAKFNDTAKGQHAKGMVMHGDIEALSIYANKLIQKGSDVIHGIIREVSLAMSGSNPGAKIDNLVIQHADGSINESEDEALIYTDEKIKVGMIEHTLGEDNETLQEIFDTFNEKQKNVVYAMLAQVTLEQSEVKMEADSEEIIPAEPEIKHTTDVGEILMKKNAFDNTDGTTVKNVSMTNEQFKAIMDEAQLKKASFRDTFIAHAGTYGIDNIEILFPDAQAVRNTPDFIKRDTEWVSKVLNGTHHSPFSRIKSMAADLTADEARAKGYVKSNLKKDEVFGLLSRVTTATTIYKKQKLDRDDIVDITGFNVVVWVKGEMRMMLDEELARALLIGDGRDVEDEDHINTTNLRPIWTDDDLYAHHVKLAEDREIEDVIDDIVRARKAYKGSGSPTLYTSPTILTDMLLVKASDGRRMYSTMAELTAALRVADIVEIPLMEDMTRTVGAENLSLIGIIVNLKDYTIGADNGGEVNMFDDFDIDHNQQKYLLETRVSGTLTRPKSALVIEQVTSAG